LLAAGAVACGSAEISGPQEYAAESTSSRDLFERLQRLERDVGFGC